MAETTTPGCCAVPGRAAPAPDAIVLPRPASSTDSVARAKFAASRSFIGTDHPAIPGDGEGPRRPVNLAAFALEVVPVTNRRFAAFVAATGYVTEAERFGWSPVFHLLLPTPPPPGGHRHWWVATEGACWSTPEGPGSSIADRLDHPVVQVSWADANAFASWSGGRLPTEAEWEHAARGGLDDPRFPWGDAEPDDDAAIFANIWQGEFPHSNTLTDGYLGTSPVGHFAANGAGLHDMSGNVWEWTADAFRPNAPERVMKGGSFLCHRSWCYRYRIAARSAMEQDSCASNTGFRVAYD